MSQRDVEFDCILPFHARAQTFEKRGCEFKEFYKGGVNLKKSLILRPKDLLQLSIAMCLRKR